MGQVLVRENLGQTDYDALMKQVDLQEQGRQFSNKQARESLDQHVVEGLAAVEALPGETARAFGPFRLVRYTQYLLRELFLGVDVLGADDQAANARALRAALGPRLHAAGVTLLRAAKAADEEGAA